MFKLNVFTTKDFHQLLTKLIRDVNLKKSITKVLKVLTQIWFIQLLHCLPKNNKC